VPNEAELLAQLVQATKDAMVASSRAHERISLLEHDLSAVRIALTAFLTTATKEQLRVVGARLSTNPRELSETGELLPVEDEERLRGAMADLRAVIRRRLLAIDPELHLYEAPPSQPEGG
jgi:hypothetical protein